MERTSRRQSPDDDHSESVAGTASGGQETLLQAALDAFVEHGFHGTSMRDIAARAGLSVSASYYYFPSKQHLLMRIMTRVTEDLIAALRKAHAAAGDAPAAQLAAIVRMHVLFHTERQMESFVGNSELRSLSAADRAAVVALRDRVSSIFKQVIGAGARRGQFECPHPAEASLAVTTMCTAVAGWYRPGGRLGASAIADRYVAMALRLVGSR